jgi:hypothetical protein
MRWISPVLLFLSIGTISMSSAEPQPAVTGSPPLLPDLVIDNVAFGPAVCLNIDVRNIGPGSKPAGSVVTYQLDATYHDPEQSRTVTGTLTDLTPIEIPSQSDRATAICDVSGEAINAYRMGLIRLTLNPTASLPEVSTANNSRDIASPRWVGADVEITGGSLAAGGPGPYDPVVATVRLKNLGNQLPQTMPGIVVLIVARGSGPRPFAPYEVHNFIYEPLNPGEDHVYQIALTPPLPVVSRLLPGFFACVWGIAQLDNGGYSLFIWPQEYQGRFATGGVPVPDPGGAACWSGWNIRSWEIERPPRD